MLLYQSRGVMRQCGGAFSVPRVGGGVWSRTLILRRTCEVSESYGLERELHVHSLAVGSVKVIYKIPTIRTRCLIIVRTTRSTFKLSRKL